MKIKNIILALALLSTLPMTAQEYSLTLKECLEKGLENNYSLRIVRNREQMAANNTGWANAGMLPTATATASYSGTLNNSDSEPREAGASKVSQRNVTDHTLRAGIDLQWTIFDGFKMQADYNILKELHLQSQTQTRIAVENFIADFTAEYYNFILQRLRMNNLNYAVRLSRERMRIVQDRFIIGNNSRLDLLQAQVDFNADSAQSVKQYEQLLTSRIHLYELMAERNIDNHFIVADSIIYVDNQLDFDTLWQATLANNAELLSAAHSSRIAALDLKSIQSRDYPYVRLNAGYGYTHVNYDVNTTLNRSEWGADFGVSIGFNLFDGKRSRQRRNAKLAVANAKLEQEELELTLYADLNYLWQSYENNKRLLALERQNVIAARQNYDIAYERYLLGNLSGIEMREAQKSLLDAEDRILVAEFNTKLCEISLLQLSGNISVYLR